METMLFRSWVLIWCCLSGILATSQWVVRMIAAPDIPKAAVLGNHDAWYTASIGVARSRPTTQRRLGTGTAEFWGNPCRLWQLDFPALNLTVVGSRPFSWVVRFGKMPILSRAVRVTNFKESSPNRSRQRRVQPRNVDFLGHNGPVGLGDRAEDPWQRLANR